HSPGGVRRGDRVFAPAVRPAQLADHRRHSPFDRGDRCRGHRAPGRTSAAAGRVTMSLWLPAAPLVLASKSAARRAMIEATGIPLELIPADIDERAVEARAGPGNPSEAAMLLAR